MRLFTFNLYTIHVDFIIKTNVLNTLLHKRTDILLKFSCLRSGTIFGVQQTNRGKNGQTEWIV